MSSFLTVLGFLLLTAFFAANHLRAHRKGESSVRCPRCNATVLAGSVRCSRCDVPLQLFEITGAERTAEDLVDSGEPHALVRADVCVGCAACVPPCPVPGAIRMQGKLAVVDPTLCSGHALCVEACPVGAILITTGAAVHRVEVPDVSATFETNVPGIYLVGELGGRGLIKNAINEGKVAVEAVAHALEGRQAREDVLDVVIVGSGPAGLSAGLEAHRQELSYVVLEQGNLADTIRKYPRKKLLLAEPITVPLYGDLWISDGSKEELLRIWEAIVQNVGLRVQTNCRVTSIERVGSGPFEITAGAHHFRARRVVLAMGRRGTPRRLGVPGEELDKVFYDIAEMEEFAGTRALVVGGGDSALESALGLANQPGTQVTLSYRGVGFEKAKERNRTKLDAEVGAGRVKLLLESNVVRIDPDEVTISTPDGELRLPNDVVIIRAGGIPPTGFLRDLGIGIVKKDIPITQAEETRVG